MGERVGLFCFPRATLIGRRGSRTEVGKDVVGAPDFWFWFCFLALVVLLCCCYELQLLYVRFMAVRGRVLWVESLRVLSGRVPWRPNIGLAVSRSSLSPVTSCAASRLSQTSVSLRSDPRTLTSLLVISSD